MISGRALLFLLISAPAGFAIRALVAPESEAVSLLVGGLVLAALDGVYRLRFKGAGFYLQWIAANSGAYILFLPAWMWGIGLLVSGLIQVIPGHAAIT